VREPGVIAGAIEAEGREHVLLTGAVAG
jgi:hypothetical protein